MVTILIVDDDPKLLNLLRRTLRYEGFRVLSATNGAGLICAGLRDSPRIQIQIAHASWPRHSA